MAKKQSGEGDIVCGPRYALREESSSTRLTAEVAYSFEERLIDPDDEDQDDAWTRLKGSSKELARRRSMGYTKTPS